MNYVDIYDNSKKAVVQLVISPDNVIPSNYFIATFPGATGLIYKNSDSNKFISIPKDTNGNFRWEWNPNIFYDLIYADRMKISGIGDLLSHLSLLISNFSKSFIVIFINQPPTERSSFIIRIILLIILSLIYIISVIFITPALIKCLFNKVTACIQTIDLQPLAYHAPSPVPFILDNRINEAL
ncbi:unnamed protein product [Rotaria magnacalcarata]|uniref:Uncharacterized protein n=2 Tax=Rotaria magnacalcarata TaxID=392030 RepID=A0A814EV45_9BILA|nr:unnamed protein product [Rotaria magnacalcarata]CAF1211379.1 unnamed protein product [Rotaria magnacalcarata]CAF1914146.1 unnamed protein product [Rotaria magnacalcarata]CAF3746342.1 unnamed protein product [Rotaria magnacalcarata]CAF3780232.1 unnamed protein product [Rotaria magnacalcarata]